MELWVRSQNKGALIKVEMLGKTDETIYSYSGINKTELGTYKSYERALEVLDEIQEVLCPKILTMKPNSQITLNDGVNIVLPDNCSYERIGDTYVFEMPKE